MTDPFFDFINSGFAAWTEIFMQHRVFLGDELTSTPHEISPATFVDVRGLVALDDPTPKQMRATRYMYGIVIPRPVLDRALAATGLSLDVLDKSNDEEFTPWAILEGGDPTPYAVRVHSKIVWEQDNPIITLRRLWNREAGAASWVGGLT